MIAKKITPVVAEALLGGKLTGQLQFLAGHNGGFAKTFRDVVVLGIAALRVKLWPDPVATQPLKPEDLGFHSRNVTM